MEGWFKGGDILDNVKNVKQIQNLGGGKILGVPHLVVQGNCIGKVK